MRIALIGPGVIPIPPTGWGAIEILIHDLRVWLERNGHIVAVVNTPSVDDMVQQVNDFLPDFVHCHADNFMSSLHRINCPAKAATSHFGYLNEVWRHDAYVRDVHVPLIQQTDVHVFALSPSILEGYVADGIAPLRLHLMPNGVRCDLFSVTETPRLATRSICLAKIYRRKRQGFLQKAAVQIDFVGNTTLKAAYGCGFNPTRPDYLGQWTKAEVYEHLTDYANLVLLSDGEAHPLVCLEALAAGLGVVVSQAAAANLDPNLPFIDIIDDEHLNDSNHVRAVIDRNRKVSIASRPQILAYAQTFSFERMVRRYLDTVGAIVASSDMEKPRLPHVARVGLFVRIDRPEKVAKLQDWLVEAQSLSSSVSLTLNPVFTSGTLSNTGVPSNSDGYLQRLGDWWWAQYMIGDEDCLPQYDIVFIGDPDQLLNLDLKLILSGGFFAASRPMPVSAPRGSSARVPDHVPAPSVSLCAWGGAVPYVRQASKLMLLAFGKDLSDGVLVEPDAYLRLAFAQALRIGVARSLPGPIGMKADNLDTTAITMLLNKLRAPSQSAPAHPSSLTGTLPRPEDIFGTPPISPLKRFGLRLKMRATISFWRTKFRWVQRAHRLS